MKATYLIGVAGGSGSGKTTVVDLITKACPELEIMVLQQDHYYRDLSHLPRDQRAEFNFDRPDSIDLELFIQHLEMLTRGEAIDRPTYSFTDHIRTDEVVRLKPKPILIVDGIFALSSKELRDLYSLKLFVDVPDDLRFIRRLQRDIEERGRSQESVVDQYLQTVRPMYEKYIAGCKKQADFLVYWEDMNYPAIDLIASLLRLKYYFQPKALP